MYYGYSWRAGRDVLLCRQAEFKSQWATIYDFLWEYCQPVWYAGFRAVVAIISGRSNLLTRGKPIGATKGTSYASKAARSVFKKTKFPFGMSLPTWLGGYTPWTARKAMVRNIAPFVGRSIPLLGLIIIAADVSAITYRTIRDYNMIARGGDKLW